MNKTPYTWVFNFEIVIPLEVGLSTIRTEAYDDKNNSQILAQDLNLIDERRENALVRMANY